MRVHDPLMFISRSLSPFFKGFVISLPHGDGLSSAFFSMPVSVCTVSIFGFAAVIFFSHTLSNGTPIAQ